MGEKSSIEWTGATWTPIRARNRKTGKVGWHCTKPSPGCKICYAEKINKRLGTGFPFKPSHEKDIEIFLDDEMLMAPLRWKKPRMIFVCSMTDLFADFVKDEWIDKLFAVMALCPQHTFQVLTKRAKRMREYMMEQWQPAPAQTIKMGNDSFDLKGESGPTGRESRVEEACEPIARKLGLTDPDKDELWTEDGKCKALQWNWPLPNVWLGVSAEDQQRADERIPDLLATPAAIRFVSAEPLLGPWYPESTPNSTDPDGLLNCLYAPSKAFGGVTAAKLDWIIVGGESGREARPMHPDWARSLRDQCAAAGAKFFFKQWGENWPAEIVRKGEEGEWWRRFPEGERWLISECGAENPPAVHFSAVGKKRAGRLLDGVEHNGMPEVPR